MITLPYIPKSIRDKQFWEKASSVLGVHPVVARCIRLDYLCMERDTWLDYIVKKKIKNLDLTNPFSEEEIEKRKKMVRLIFGQLNAVILILESCAIEHPKNRFPFDR